MRWLFIVLLFIFLVEFIFASCGEGQIDINSASLEELQNITQIGPSYAEQIIKLRPFDSIDELTQVSGIAEVRLSKIKEEGLACVKENSNSEKKETKPEEQEDEEEQESLEERLIELNKNIDKESSEEEREIIELNSATSQTIKSGNYMKSLSEKNYAKYGLGLFCILLGGLFAIRKNKLRKNEFR